MAARIVLASLLLGCLAQVCYGNVLFSSLNRSLDVSSTVPQGQVLKGGVDKLTVTWSLNASFTGKDADYKTVKVKLCYAPVSQKDRGWRKTVDNLKKDKTCPHLVGAKPYNSSSTTGSVEWIVTKDIPTATYFIRAYAFNAVGDQVAYGQTTDSKKATNLFEVEAITGRHVSLDISAICFSAFSILSLAGFFIAEKRSKSKNSPPQM